MLREVDWADARVKLFAAALKVTHSKARSQELADRVILLCFDPEGKPWNPNAQPDVRKHALYVLKNVLSSDRKKYLVRTHPKNTATVELLLPRTLDPSERLEQAQRSARDARVMAATRARLSEPLDGELLGLSLDGIDKPAEQAARLGRPIEDIRRARERVKYALRAAIEEDEATR
jgi:hypothetical protein